MSPRGSGAMMRTQNQYWADIVLTPSIESNSNEHSNKVRCLSISCVCVLITSIQKHVVGNLLWWLGCRFVYLLLDLSRRATPHIVGPSSIMYLLLPIFETAFTIIPNMLDSLRNLGQRILRITDSRYLIRLCSQTQIPRRVEGRVKKKCLPTNIIANGCPMCAYYLQ